MNQQPITTVRVSHEALTAFCAAALRQADMPAEQADLLAGILVGNDLHGLENHGSWQVARYVPRLLEGSLNPRPAVGVERRTEHSAVFEGDGGLGYFPLHEATLWAIAQARAHGMAAAVTRSHGHIGAAGTYARLAVAQGLCAFVTSGMTLKLEPGTSVERAAGVSPMAFAAPGQDEPPLVLDCGVMQYIRGRRTTHHDQIVALAPGLVLRWIGFGTVCQAWGGLLAGLSVDPSRGPQRWRAADQGAMMFAFDPGLFADARQFRAEMDEYARRVRLLEPVPGTAGAYLPGAVELQREARYRQEGVPLRDDHRRDLEQIATQLGVDVPWR
jgi:L-2-hydroxycarboxylate dehydrogenase (NAD+)